MFDVRTGKSEAPAQHRTINIGDEENRTSRGRIVRVGDIAFGGDEVVVIAGPCSVETEDQIMEAAFGVKMRGATMLRGGAFKPRTSPHDFQGHGVEGLKLLRRAGDAVGLQIVTEIMSEDDIGVGCEYADMIQIGARNMQNFSLLKKIGKIDRPVLLKRGLSATVKEWLNAAEYVLQGGNERVVLCERGIRTFDNSLRNTLDLAAVALVKEISDLPVIVDPSHATGRRSLISAASKAAIAVGADGVIIEVHPSPDEAWSDSAQSIDLEMFGEVMKAMASPLRRVRNAAPTATYAIR